MNKPHTSVDDLLDLNDFNPNNEKESYNTFHENVERYTSQSMDTPTHGYPNNAPPPEMFLHTLDKARSNQTPEIRPSMNMNDVRENFETSYNNNIPKQIPEPFYQPQTQNNPFHVAQQQADNVKYNNEMNQKEEYYPDMLRQPNPQEMPQQVYHEPEIIHHPEHNSHHSCVDLHDHIQSCKICSHYYNTDKTIYMVVIIILLIICALLIRKVLNL